MAIKVWYSIHLYRLHFCWLWSSFYLTDANQEKIVEEGGLDALLLLLETSKDTTIHRVTAGAVANLAMNGIFFKNA